MLGIHAKPCALLDVAGFYAGMRAHVEHMVRSGFIDRVQVGGLLIDDDPARLLDRLATWQAPAPKWADGPPP